MTGRRPSMRLLRVWAPAAGLMAAFFVVSRTPIPPVPIGLAVSDLIAHAVAYAFLGAAMLRGVAGAKWAGVTAGGAVLAAVLAAAYGLADEFHQSFVPGRTSELRDVAADALGSAAGAGLIWAWSIVLAVRARRNAA